MWRTLLVSAATRFVWWAAKKAYHGNRERAWTLLQAEIMSAPHNVLLAMEYTDAETELLSQRLSRRYDPSMALSEATNRSVAAKKTAEAEGMGLTAKQLAALEWKKHKMRGVLKRS